MKILIAANHYPVCSARYMADAFTRLGHEVRHIGPEMGNNIWGLTLPDRYVWVPDNVQWAREASINEYPDWHQDMILGMDSDPQRLDDLIKLKAPESGPVVVYGVDNHVRNYRRDYIDHYFLAHRFGQCQPVKEADETWLPCGFDPTVFKPSTIPWAERKYDVACLGVMYPIRQRFVKALMDAGYKVAWGSGLVYESYAAIYQNSRMSLCLSANDDLAQRFFETWACGCIVLTDFVAELRDEDTVRSLRLHGYSTIQGENEARQIQEMLDFVGDYLEYPIPKYGIVNGFTAVDYERDLARHTWDARAKTIVDWYERKYGVAKTLS